MRTLSRSKMTLTSAMLTLAAGASLAWADLPAAMDRVPANTPIVVGVRNVDALKTRVMGLLEQLDVPVDGEGMAEINALLKSDGVNPQGSVALAMTPPADDGEGKPKIVALVPTNNAAALIKSLKGDASQKIAEVTMPGEKQEKGYAKDIGNGYVAFADTRETAEAFAGTAGSMAQFKKDLGAAGNRVGDAADVFVVFNVTSLHDHLEQGVMMMKQQAEMMQQMMGQAGGAEADQVKAGMSIITGAADAFLADGQVAYMGLNLDSHGVNMDFGAQFKEGSNSAKVFATGGNASRLTGRLPQTPFLFAGSMDTSAPAMKQLIKDMQAKAPKAGANMGMGDMMKMIDDVDGVSFVMGQADMGAGLFAKSSYYVASKDSNKLLDAYSNMMKGMNGQKVQGITYVTEVKPDGADVAGTKVNTWSMSMDVDPNEPAAQQIAMINNIFFGPEGGLSGYSAAVPGGVVITMSRNSDLMKSAMDSAKSGMGLGGDDLFKQTAAALPAERTGEFYIGTKAVLDTVSAFMAMFGAQQELKTPEKLAPIGMGMTTNGGGVSVRMHMPNDALKFFVELGKNEGGDEEPDMGEEKGGKATPRF